MLDQLKDQLDKNAQLIAAVKADQMTRSTPCPKYDTHALINHMIAGNYFFIEIAQGNTVDGSGEPPDMVGNDPVGSYQQSVNALMETLNQPGVMERAFRFPFGEMPGAMATGIWLMETTVHGWDLAKATGQDTSIDPQIAAMLLQGAQAVDGMRNPEGNPFGPKVDVPEDASAGDKLVGFLGRTP